jgi:glycosyltransferase involved in cell wall biosynthesis
LRILITSPYPLWPETAGGIRRTLGIARALAAMGHEVTLLGADSIPPAGALPQGLAAAAYATGGGIGYFLNRAFVRALDAQLVRGVELVVASFPYQAWMLLRACGRHSVPLVYDAHNVESERFASLGSPLLARLVHWAEARLCREAAAVLAVSEDDQRRFWARYGASALLLPNGVDTDTFVPALPDQALLEQLGLRGKRVALYCGTFDYPPNREVLDYLLRLRWPLRQQGRPDTHLLVVGRKPPAWAQDVAGVVVAGEVDNLVPYLNLANLSLVPLRSGGGTRLKIIESLACAQQVLSTRFGAAGLLHEAIPGLYLCDLEDFEAHLQKLLAQDIQPGSNPGGRGWALGLNWQLSVAALDWASMVNR